MREVIKKTAEFFFCFLALLGICAAGSDGPWFPWPNLAGLALFLILILWLARQKVNRINTRLIEFPAHNDRKLGG